MSTRVKKSVPWRDVLMSNIGNPEEAIPYLNACAEDNDPAFLCSALIEVIQANKNLATIVIPAYARCLTSTEIHKLADSFPELNSFIQSNLNILQMLKAS